MKTLSLVGFRSELRKLIGELQYFPVENQKVFIEQQISYEVIKKAFNLTLDHMKC